jgi:uncharacterized protein (TIGR04168 family)
VGDVHDAWDALDNHVLESLSPDLALFVGDFGNENVDLVSLISRCRVPKACILGNHDCWYSGFKGKRRLALAGKGNEPSRIQKQISVLGTSHVVRTRGC